MEILIKLHTLKQNSQLYIWMGHRLYCQNNIIFLSLEIDFLAKRADSDEMPHYVASYLGLLCSSKYLFRSFQSLKG